MTKRIEKHIDKKHFIYYNYHTNNGEKHMTTKSIIIFITLQLLNVVLSTIRSILTVKANRLIASLSASVAYGVYAVVTVVMVSGFDLWLVVAVTVGTNFIGTYFSKWLLDKFRKDKLWDITAIVSKTLAPEIKEKLAAQQIDCYYILLESRKAVLHIFSKNQAQSTAIKSLLQNYECYYTIQEQTVQL